MNTRPIWYQTKPSADRLGNAFYVHGRLHGMDTPREPIWRRLFKGGRHG